MTKKVEKNTRGKKNTALENQKVRKNSVSVIETPVSPFVKMTRSELLARYKANVAERKRISEENKELSRLYKIAKAQKKSGPEKSK
jgi:hypothetical protein